MADLDQHGGCHERQDSDVAVILGVLQAVVWAGHCGGGWGGQGAA